MDKINIVVGSNNPVKIKTVRLAFEQVFPQTICEVQGIAVPSGVADQPMTDAATYQGAANRARNCQKALPEAHFWVGVEGGIDELHGAMQAFAWIYIISPEQSGQARTATFDLPEAIRQLIHKGIELGEADDRIFQRKNSKQGQGAVGILTHELIDRTEYYRPAVVLALIPFVNKGLY